MYVEEIVIGLLEVIEDASPRSESPAIEAAKDYLYAHGYRLDSIIGKTWVKAWVK